MPQLKAQLRQQIAQGNIETVIQTLLEKVEDGQQNEITQLAGRYAELQRKSRIGVLSNSEENLQRNQLTNALLEIINNLPDGTSITISKPPPIIPPNDTAVKREYKQE